MRRLLKNFILVGVAYVFLGYVPWVRDNETLYYLAYFGYFIYSAYVLFRGVYVLSKRLGSSTFLVTVAFPVWLSAHTLGCLSIHGIVFLNGSKEYHPWYVFAWALFLLTGFVAFLKVWVTSEEVID
jgi:hypothetical protein